MSLRAKGHLWPAMSRLAMVSIPALMLGACDFGYNAGYYDGFDLGSKEKTEKADKTAAIDETAQVLSMPLSWPDPVQAAAAEPVKTSAGKARAKVVAAKPAARPAPARASVSTKTEPQPETAAVEANVAPAAPAAAAAKAKPQPGIMPFAPLRPGASGGGAIIRVGNSPAPGGTPDDPDDDDDGDSGSDAPKTGHPGHGKSDTKNSDSGEAYASPAPAPVKPATQIAKITVIDTAIVGKGGSGSLAGVGLASSTPVQSQLASINVLSGSTIASVSIGKADGGKADGGKTGGGQLAGVSVGSTTPAQGSVVAVSALPSGGADSLASISVGNAPVVTGGAAPLVSVSALPDLGGVTNVVSPVTGAVVAPVASTAASTTAAVGNTVSATTAAVGATVASVPVVGAPVANIATTTGNVVGGLLGGKH